MSPPFPAEEFIARVTQHIPEKGFQMVRYYGTPTGPWVSGARREC
ncbi:MAG: transposase [Deltaproteobacteria bacterium]|nr:transposase [Deltaproteobacteria bacterium]